MVDVLGAPDCLVHPLTMGPASPGGSTSAPKKPESNEFTS
jgi:hypothetical protein